jgi:hypothetical protein
MSRSKPLSCPQGQIMRISYRRKLPHSKRTIRVSRVCIKDVGRPGKGKKILPKLKPGKLSQFGYEKIIDLSTPERQHILKIAIDKIGHREIIGRLTVLANYTKLSNPKFHKIIKNDQEWVSQKYNLWKEKHGHIEHYVSKRMKEERRKKKKKL